MDSSLRSNLASSVALGGLHLGVVESFNADSGLGELRLIEHPATLVQFHCMVISDGSRQVPVGAAVAVRLGFAPDGGLEAGHVLLLPR